MVSTVLRITVDVAEPSVKTEVAIESVNGGESAAIASRLQSAVFYKTQGFFNIMSGFGGGMMAVGLGFVVFRRGKTYLDKNVTGEPSQDRRV